MTDQKLPTPTYPVDLTRNVVPRTVARIIDDPVDDAQMQMGLAVRDAATEQEAKAWLAERTQRIEEHFGTGGMQALARVVRAAKTVNAEFDGTETIDQVLRAFATDVVVSTADSFMKQKQALVEEVGDVSQRDIRPKRTAQPTPVVVQAGPKLRPARLFESGKQKYVIDD